MEIILLIVLFVAPGMICRALHESFNKEKRDYRNDYDYLLHVVIDSVVINSMVLWIINLFGRQIVSFYWLNVYLQYFDNVMTYVIIMLIIAVVWSVVKWVFFFPCYMWVKNFILKRDHHAHSKHTTDWDDLLNDKAIKGHWQVLSIYKDDAYITSGMRYSSTTTNSDQFEIRLEKVEMIEKMKKERPNLFEIKYDYYNTATGLRVVFYDQEKIEEHWGDVN